MIAELIANDEFKKNRDTQQIKPKVNIPKVSMINDTSVIATKKSEPFYQLDDLPEGVSISTITLTCKFDTTFNAHNIGRYLELIPNTIIGIKYGDGEKSSKTLVIKKRRAKKKVKKPKSFFNQVTIVVQSENNNEINIKFFKNGSVHVTGCKSAKHFENSIKIAFEELKKVKAVYDPIQKKIIKKPFLTNPENFDIDHINDISIRMINNGFKLGFKIDREDVYNIFKSKNVSCTYEPCVHACVNIKYNYKNTSSLSVFVFESGSIIITGVKTKDHIDEAYKFIIKFIYENFNKIYKVDTEEFLERPEVKQLIDDCKLINSLKCKIATISG